MNKTIPTYDRWRSVPDDFATRPQWLKRGRQIKSNEEPTARWITTVEAGPDSYGEVWLDDPDLYLLVEKAIPLYHQDQTKPVNLTSRSLAYLGYEDIFYEPASKDRHIVQNETWMTVTANPTAPFFWAKGYLTRQEIHRHINGRKIIGIVASEKTRFLTIDHDFHGNDRQVFLEQTEILLGHFHGWGTWHYQVRVGKISGMHYLLTFDAPKNLDKLLKYVRQRLVQLDEEHPELAARAKAAGMPSFAKMELYPQRNKGFRLPLCRGYQMLLDRPLPLTTYRNREVQDVVAYIDWLNDPCRKYMPKAEILELLRTNLGEGKPVAQQMPAAKTQLTPKPVIKQPCSSGIGSLKGCCRQKVTGFWRGTFNPEGSLNKFLIVSARILFFEGVSEEDAVELLQEYVRDLPVEAWGCSKRLLNEEWASIDASIRSDVAQAYDNNDGQGDIDTSTDKLKAAVVYWDKVGFRLSDKTTWHLGDRSPEGVQHVVWSEEDKQQIADVLGGALGRKYAHLACEVASAVVNVVAKQRASENGMGYGYWAALLEDQFAIPCGNRNKISRIIKACEELQLIRKHCKAIFWGPQRGLATVYGLGGLARRSLNRKKDIDLSISVSIH